jgi:hypothetical protein
MTKIQFDNGQVVEFEGKPTPKDIDFVANKLGIPQKKNIVGEVGEQLVSGPGRDLTAGILKGMQNVQKPISSVLEFSRVPDELNLFKQSIGYYDNLLQNLPPARSDKYSRFINEMIGETPGIIAEFQQGGSLLRAPKIASTLSRFKGVGPAAELAVTRALEELKGGPVKAIKAGAEGAAVGLWVPVAIRGMGMLRSGLKDGAKKLIEVITGNKRLAEDFVKNPFRYSLRFFDKNIKRLDEARIENKRIKENLIEKQKAELESFRSSQRKVSEDASLKRKHASESLKAEATSAKESLTREGQLKIDDVSQSVTRNINEKTSLYAQRINNELDSVYQYANKLKQHEGELVGDAIEGIVAINPSAGIPISSIRLAIRPTLIDGQKRGLYKLGKVGTTVTPVTSGQRQLTSRINGFLDDLKLSLTKEKEVPLEVLQGLKNDARRISQKAYNAGDYNTSNIFSKLSDSINPAKIVSQNPVLSNRMSALAEANAAFTKRIKPFNELTELITTKDANGNVIIDTTKVVSAVKNNNTQVINRLRKIDTSLPNEQRILPKIKSHISGVEKSVSEQRAYLKSVKKSVSESIKIVDKKFKALQSNLSKNQRSDKFKFSEEQRNGMISKMNEQRKKLLDLNKQLDDESLFLEDLHQIRAFQGAGLTGLLQRVGAFGSVIPILLGGGTGSLTAGLSVTLGLSPAMVGRFVQSASRSANLVDPLIQELRSRGLDKLAGRLIASKQE